MPVRGTGRHRLGEDDAERLAAGVRRDVQVAGREHRHLVLVAHPTEERHDVATVGRDAATYLFDVAPPRDQQTGAGPFAVDLRPCIQQDRKPLPRLVEAPQERQGSAVTPPVRSRREPAETGDGQPLWYYPPGGAP